MACEVNVIYPQFMQGLFLGNEGIRDSFTKDAARGEQITYPRGLFFTWAKFENCGVKQW